MKKCLFVYNPQSGKGKVVKKEKYIVEMLSKEYEVTLGRSAYAGNITEIILEKGNEQDLIVVAGGDGTLNEAINAIKQLDKPVKVGYIPAGTVNDVAHSLKIPRSIKKAVRNILTGTEFKHDIIKVNDKYGIYVCCAGLFTSSSYSTSQKVKKRAGKIAYAFNGIKKVFSTPAVKLKLTYADGEIEGKYALMLILNSRYVAGFRFNKNAKLNDGVVDVILVESNNDIVKLNTITKVALMFLKGLRKKFKKGITHIMLDKFSINLTEDTVINLDGEKIAKGNFDFEVIKEGISIIVPQTK